MSGIFGKLSFDPDEAIVIDSAATNERGDVHVVSDSTISNAPHLREHLVQRSHRFQGAADNELIAHAYEEWDLRCVDRFRGAFAFAVWDEARRRLLLVRDHIGLQPLYFALLSGHGVAFASDIRALLRVPGVGRNWCPDAIDAYLALGYVPAPLTAYRRISKLEPAQLLVVDGRCLRVEQYWDLPFATTGATLDERVAVLEELLAAAARSQPTSTGATGLLYSGGTASSTLLAATPRRANPVVTIDVEEEAAELTRSDAAACHLGRTRELEVVRPDASALALDFSANCDGPTAGPSAVAQFAIYRAVRRHMDTAVTAHGAGVLWAGYARYRVERMELTVRAWLGGRLATIGAQIATPLHGSIKGARALSHLSLPKAHACAVKHAYGLWDDEYRRAIDTRAFAWLVRDANPFRRHLELYAGCYNTVRLQAARKYRDAPPAAASSEEASGWRDAAGTPARGAAFLAARGTDVDGPGGSLHTPLQRPGHRVPSGVDASVGGASPRALRSRTPALVSRDARVLVPHVGRWGRGDGASRICGAEGGGLTCAE